MTRVVGYARVSTRGQAERGTSVPAQQDAIRECAKAKGWELLEIVSEAASGGVRGDEIFSYEHRPVLLALMERAELGEYDVLLVAKLDRLSRDHITLVALERRLQRSEVEVVSVAEEGNGDGPLADFIRGQLALVAELERGMILERVGAGKAKKKALGRHVHGRIPFGYSSEAGVLTPDPEQALLVRRIFRDVIDGRSPGRIARELTAEGVPSPQGGAAWSANGVRLIATNSAYAGDRYGVKRAHEGIVSRRMFNAAGEALRARSRKHEPL